MRRHLRSAATETSSRTATDLSERQRFGSAVVGSWEAIGELISEMVKAIGQTSVWRSRLNGSMDRPSNSYRLRRASGELKAQESNKTYIVKLIVTPRVKSRQAWEQVESSK